MADKRVERDPAAVFWPQPRQAEGADTTKLEVRRSEKQAEIKGLTDAELLADRSVTKGKITAMIAEKNPAGARGYEQGLAMVDAEARGRGLVVEQAAAAQEAPAKTRGGGRGD